MVVVVIGTVGWGGVGWAGRSGHGHPFMRTETKVAHKRFLKPQKTTRCVVVFVNFSTGIILNMVTMI